MKRLRGGLLLYGGGVIVDVGEEWGGGLLLSLGGWVVVLFLFYLAFAPAGTRAFAGVSCYRWNGVVFFNIRPLRPVELVFLHEFHRWNGVVSFLSGLCACWDSCVCRGFFYPWNGVVFFNIRPLRPVELVFLHEFHRWNGVVSFLSGLCACWDSCVCRGFMLSLEWCCFF